MSQYLNLFLKGKEEPYNNVILPLAQYSRSSDFYQLWDKEIPLPYEEVVVLTAENITLLRNSVETSLKTLHGKIELSKQILINLKPGNDYDEYLNHMEDITHDIEEFKELIEVYIGIKYFLIFLEDIVLSGQCQVLYGIEAWFDDNGKLKEE